MSSGWLVIKNTLTEKNLGEKVLIKLGEGFHGTARGKVEGRSEGGGLEERNSGKGERGHFDSGGGKRETMSSAKNAALQTEVRIWGGGDNGYQLSFKRYVGGVGLALKST